MLTKFEPLFAQIREFQAEKQQQMQLQEEEMQRRLEVLKSELAEQAVYDQERCVGFF